ncbi:hypothetical protein [uncultured Hyphomicrobium sp.]|jgi:hypothetical protein|uniref:hypothetical protein n=1 Tax=uncultured Hyphomicrobium sp. TaxID=194373 RepID=UPI0025E2B323|nr:hypothetical protein [uncultured Hyphomicrobium sp.]
MSQLKTPVGKLVVDTLVDVLTKAPIPNVPLRAHFTVLIDARGNKQIFGDAYPYTEEVYSQQARQTPLLTYDPYPSLSATRSR